MRWDSGTQNANSTTWTKRVSVAKLHKRSKGKMPRASYQKEVRGARVLPGRKDSRAAEFAERYIREHPLVFRKLANR